MATTYTLISSNVLASNATSISFSSIPGTYTDLVLRTSTRGSNAQDRDAFVITFNSDTGSNYSVTYLIGNGITASSSRLSSQADWRFQWPTQGTAYTASTFGSAEIYIPSYTASQSKPISAIGTGESNVSNPDTVYMTANAALWRNNAAITSIQIAPYFSSNFVTGSSFYLYGIKNS
jgi:hypothetical protein